MAVQRWCQQSGAESHYITPGKPMQNAFAESFIIDGPAGASVLSVMFIGGCVHVFGLFVQPIHDCWP
ncbi:hypothetical protein MPLA_2130129 [Mesorhizobium sp. ORS 3359]|nr:hypothetical protein MPLA_2130129 [Mesorhizobium sp. ORS 3359]